MASDEHAHAHDSEGPNMSEDTDAPTSTTKADDDKEECGWCRWMKGGGCRDTFQAWQECIDEVAEAGTDDAPTKCSQQMDALLTCMMKNKDYYEDQLSAMFSGPGEAKEQEPPDTATQSSPSPEETPRQKDTSTVQQGIPDADQGQSREPSVVVESSVED